MQVMNDYLLVVETENSVNLIEERSFLDDGGWTYFRGFWILDHEKIMNEILSEIELEHKTLTFKGNTFKMPRLTAWFGDKHYNYSGTINKAKPFPSSLQRIREDLKKYYNWDFNSVLCNYYRDGADSVSWHSDDEPGLGPAPNDILIGSISLGAKRRFLLRNKRTKQKIEYELGEGDLFIMGGETQKYWEHQIPKTSKKVLPRLNLTFRVVT